MMEKSRVGNWGVVGNSEWGMVGNSISWGVVGNSESWGMVGNSVSWGVVDDWSVGNSLDDSWGRTVNDGVESIDGVSGVGDGTDSTIGLNKRVLSLDNISVPRFVGGLLVSGKGVRDRVSVVVLWMGVEGLSSDGLGENWSGVDNWGMVGNSISWGSMSNSHWVVGNSVSYWGTISGQSRVSGDVLWGGSGSADHSEEGEEPVHDGFFWVFTESSAAVSNCNNIQFDNAAGLTVEAQKKPS